MSPHLGPCHRAVRMLTTSSRFGCGPLDHAWDLTLARGGTTTLQQGPLHHALASLVKRTTTLLRTTQTWNFLIFYREFIIIRYLFIDSNRLFGVNDNLLLTFNGNDFCIAIWLKENCIGENRECKYYMSCNVQKKIYSKIF
jgi:hypothetical protein